MKDWIATKSLYYYNNQLVFVAYFIGELFCVFMGNYALNLSVFQCNNEVNVVQRVWITVFIHWYNTWLIMHYKPNKELVTQVYVAFECMNKGFLIWMIIDLNYNIYF